MLKRLFTTGLYRTPRIRRLLWVVSSVSVLIALGLVVFPSREVDVTIAIEEPVDPMATDFFFMRNPEIRKDLLEQLSLHNIEYWVNDDDSIGFYVRDTREVDRIANESIAVWITSQ